MVDTLGALIEAKVALHRVRGTRELIRHYSDSNPLKDVSNRAMDVLVGCCEDGVEKALLAYSNDPSRRGLTEAIPGLRVMFAEAKTEMNAAEYTAEVLRSKVTRGELAEDSVEMANALYESMRCSKNFDAISNVLLELLSWENKP